MDLLDQQWYGCAVAIAVVVQLGLAYMLRRQLSGVFDLLFLNLLYVSFGSAALAIIYLTQISPQILDELGLLAAWLFAMICGTRIALQKTVRRRPALGGLDISLAGRARPSHHVASCKITSYDVTALLIVATVYVLYAVQIFSSGILSLQGSMIDERFIVQSDNKIQAYLFSAVGLIPPILIYRLWPRGSPLTVAAVLAAFWAVQAATLSKTGLLFPVIACSLYLSLRVKAGVAPRPSWRMQVIVAGALGVVVYLVFYVIAAVFVDESGAPILLLLNRLFSSFDSLVYLASLRLDPDQDLSLMQWYLSPFLKVLGWFDSQYNAFNYLLAVEYFGYSKDHTGMLPNNNHVGELIVTFKPILRISAALVSGTLYGAVYRSSLSQCMRGGAYLIPCAFIVATPLGMLIDGQGWCAAFICACLLALVAYALRPLLAPFVANGLRRRLRRAPY